MSLRSAGFGKIARLQEQVQAVEHLSHPSGRERPYLPLKIPLVDREHLTDVNDASLGQPSLSSVEEHVPWSFRPRQVGGDDTDDHGIDPAPVEDVVLYDDVRMAEPGSRA